MDDTTARGDMSIAGAGTIATGRYRKVHVAGSANMTGDIDCVSFKVSGTADGRGKLKAETMTVSGAIRFDGGVDAAEVRISGSASLGGDVRAGRLRVAGSVDVGGDFSGDTVELQGYLRVKGDCAAERFRCQGGFSVDGLLNAGAVDVTLGAPCVAKEIGGEAIVVRYSPFVLKRLVALLMPPQNLRLTVETIEGDDVRLEHTSAKVVRGTRVVLGPGCEVEFVEYTEAFEQSPNAKVKTARKVAPVSTTEGR